jgi:hypothetical protein
MYLKWIQIDLFDERETHDPVLSRTLKHDERYVIIMVFFCSNCVPEVFFSCSRVCILAVEAREFATALTDSNNSDADVSDAENGPIYSFLLLFIHQYHSF